MKKLAILYPLMISGKIRWDCWRNYSLKFYSGSQDEWGRFVINFYDDVSYIVVF